MTFKLENIIKGFELSDFYFTISFSPSPYTQAMERFQGYPPWALAMCFALIIVAMLPLPLVFIARHFNWLPDGSNKLSVSYRKSLAKEASNLEDETRFILGKNPSEAPSPMPSHRAYLGPGSTSPVELITNSTSISGYGSGYQTNPAPPKSES